MSIILRIGNKCFNRAETKGGVIAKIASAGRYSGIPIAAVSLLSGALSPISSSVASLVNEFGVSPKTVLLGIPIGFAFYGLGKLGKSIDEQGKLAREYMKQAKIAKEEKDYNAMFLAILELNRLGKRLGNRRYLDFYNRHRDYIHKKYEYEKNVQGPLMNFNVFFREYLVARSLDVFNLAMQRGRTTWASQIADNITSRLQHPLGKVKKIELLSRLFEEFMIQKKYKEAENIAEQLIVLGDKNAKEKLDILYAKRI